MAKITKPTAEDRAQILAATRNQKMASSAHAYVRGSTVKFYQWLEESAGRIPDGPPVWICGDCHVGNLGPLADAKGRVAIQIRDLDQTVIGNPAHDIIRLALSLASAARGSDLPGMTSVAMVEALVAGYEQALAADFEGGEPIETPRAVKSLLQQSTKRRWRHLARERIDGVEPTIPLGKKFWKLTDEERGEIGVLFDGHDVHGMVTALKGRDVSDPIALIDAAYWMKGCSSLGRLRYAALVRVGASEHCLIDIKEALTAAAPRAPDAKMPRDNAQRVVAGATALSPHLGHRMMAGRLLGKAVVLRELMPQDLKFEIERLSREEATQIASYLANVVGRAHGRQMDIATRQAWLGELSRNRQTSLDAPSWLWSSVVELLAIHEAEYLEHCRRHAVAQAA